MKLGRGAIAVAGLIVAFFIAILINSVAGLFGGVRADLTENKVHTLSKGTKNILQKLETPVTLRYYTTDDSDVMSPGELARARRIKERLDEFVHAAPAKTVEMANPETGEFEKKKVRMLTVEKLNPEPNTDAEDSAVVDGMRPAVSRETNNEIYMGIAVKCIDASETIPWIGANDEETLEYELARAISAVHGGKAKKIKVMTSLSVGGGMSGNFQAPPQPQWAFFQQTSQDYEVETIPPTVKEIPEDTACLIVLHPHDITDDGQFAIDQFLLGGGNVIAMVDPNFFYARSMGGGQPQMPGMPPQQGPPPTSDLDKLFKAWGVKYDSTQVLADLSFGSEIIRPGNFSPTFLTLNDQAVDGGQDDAVVHMLNHLNMLTPGAFTFDAPEGLKVDRLVQTSPNNQMVSSFDADPTQDGGTERIRENFTPSNVRKTLVARLSGTFKTAFPEGDPSAEKEEDKKEEASSEDDEKEGDKDEKAEEKKDGALKESVKPGQVFLIGDVDFIYDPICIRRQTIPGLGFEMVEPLNQNLTLVQNAIEQLSGDPDLIDVRSRSTVRRPFTRQNEWMREAEQKFSDELASFRQKEKEAEARLGELLSQSPGDLEKAIMSKEVQDEIKSLRTESAQFSRKVRELEKEVTRDFKRKQSFFKFTNFLGMPIAIIIAGIGLAVYRRSKTAAR
ncbi:MAG: Gldg family protein [Verrucomicrobiales bacterium]|nr:Gldg family protein [Verrucomicrobiales bacterium]